LPKEIPSYNGSLIFTTRQEAPKDSPKPMLYEEIFGKHPTVIRGLMIQKLDLSLEEDKLIIGIDPGERIGLSVFYFGKEIENSLYTSVEDFRSQMTRIRFSQL